MCVDHGMYYKYIFFRYLGNFQSKAFISYFSYDKPVVSFLGYDTNDDESEHIYQSNLSTIIIIYIVNVITLWI